MTKIKGGINASGGSAANGKRRLYRKTKVPSHHFVVRTHVQDKGAHRHLESPHTKGYCVLDEQSRRASRIEIKIEVIRIIC